MDNSLIILGGIVLVVCIAMLFYKPSPSKLELLQAEKVKKEAERVHMLEKLYGKRGAFFDKYGFHLWVFPESKNIVVFNHDIEERSAISYKDLVSCHVYSNTEKTGDTIIPSSSTTTYTTTTSGKSLFGRALIGAVIAGPVGAVLGGATAKKETVGETTYIPEKRRPIYKTTCFTVITYLKDGEKSEIIYNPYSLDYANEVKSIIDGVLLRQSDV